MIRYLLSALILSVAPVFADGIMPGDVKMDEASLSEKLNGQTLTFYDNGQSRFASDGEYSYTFFEGDTAPGTYTIGADSSVCIAYGNGFSRCDIYVINGERLILIAEDGSRFPIKTIEAN